PRLCERFSATKPQMRPGIASGITHAEAMTVIMLNMLTTPRIIEDVASLFPVGRAGAGIGCCAGAGAYTGHDGGGGYCGADGAREGGRGGGCSASAVSHDEFVCGRGCGAPALSHAEFACGRGCRFGSLCCRMRRSLRCATSRGDD